MEAYERDEVEFDRPVTEYAIASDAEAGWAMRKVKTIRAQRDRMIEQCQERKAAYCAEMDAKIRAVTADAEHQEQYFLAMLREYADAQPEDMFDVSRKTGVRNYRLPEGKIVFRPAKRELTHNPDVLLAALRDAGMTQYIRVKEAPAWDAVKKAAVVDDFGRVLVPDADGVLGAVEGIALTERPATFDVEVK